ncbi:MAG: hypothetical protein KAI61_07825 [Alphaproteobacteria bacterium]|nr:hypothetical protein [Alphaproteobacteria bacterium]MCK5519308.1 hypothetical protein [Alphaproteobacteria bacterium]
MIKLIGLRRIILFLCFMGINLLVASSYFLGLAPMRDEAQMHLNAVSAQISSLQNKIMNIQREVNSLKENQPKYQTLKDKGFFLVQDRFMIGRLLEEVRKKSQITSFSFTIENLKDVPNANAARMNYSLVSSRIKVEKIVSPLDSNVYIFLQLLADAFPEHTRFQNFEIKRTGEVTEAALSKIAMGKSVSFVDSSLTFDWMTLVPKVTEKPATAGFRGR